MEDSLVLIGLHKITIVVMSLWLIRISSWTIVILSGSIFTSLLKCMTNPNEFELIDICVVIRGLDIQESYNYYSNDPECAFDAFVQDIGHNEDDKYANISYQ